MEVLDNVGMYTFKAKFPCLICCYGLTTFSSVFIGTSKKSSKIAGKNVEKPYCSEIKHG